MNRYLKLNHGGEMFSIPKIVVLDFEGTSLNDDREATEIGLVALDLDLNEIGRFESVVNPYVAPSQKALEIAGLTLRDLRNAPRITEIWPAFAQYFSNAVLVMHNKEYDLKIVENNLVSAGLLPKLPPSFCTLAASKRILGNSTPGNKHRLEIVCQYLGIDNSQAHSALPDAQATLEVLLEFIDRDPSIHDELVRKANSSFPVSTLKVASSAKPRSSVRNAPNPIPAGSVRKHSEADLKQIAQEIRRNPKAEYVNVTGEVTGGFDSLNAKLKQVGLYYKETPTTQKTAFLIYGIAATGGRKVEYAKKYGRPIILDEQVDDLLKFLRN